MKLKMTEGSEKYGAPVGLYRAKFLGAKEDTHPEYGAGLKWEFEIVDGPSAGKIIGRTTSPAPTLKNGCGKMLQMLTGGIVAVNQEFDIDQYVGMVFQVMVENNSTGSGTRVGSVMPMTGTQPNPPSPSPAPPSSPPSGRTAPPPPRQSAPAATDARLAAKFWVDLPGHAPQEMTGQQLTLHVNAAKTQADLDAIGVMAHDQQGGWKKAADFGFAPEVPY